MGARPAGAGAPCPQPVIPAAPSEMLKRHNANSFALWPPHRCHGATAENKHNSPHVFSAPSTPRPSAPAPALASQDLPGLYCTVPRCTHFRASEMEQGFSRPALGKGSSGGTHPPAAPQSWFRDWQGAPKPGRGMERRRVSGQGRHKERARAAAGVLTQAPKPPLPGRRFTPSPALLQFRAEAKGQCPAEPEKSRSPATTQPGRWHQALPAWRPREDDFGGEEAAASRQGEVDGGEPAAKEMPPLHSHG